MISEQIVKIIGDYNELGKMSFLPKVSAEEIAAFEKNNNVKLPEGYKDWLQYSDGGELFLPAGVQLYGVAHKPIINVNNDDRPSKDYFVIGALASGDPILCKNNEEGIAIYNHEGGRIEDDEVYPDFLSFLTDLCNLFGIGG